MYDIHVLHQPSSVTCIQFYLILPDIRTQQQLAASSHFMEQLELTSSRPQPTSLDGQR